MVLFQDYSDTNPDYLMDKEILRQDAIKFGFSDLRFTSVEPLLEAEEKFYLWRNKGYAAEMSYMKRANPINARPQMLLNSAKSLLVFSADYYSPAPARPSLAHGRVASYAVGKDYHKVLKKKIKELCLESDAFKDLANRSRFFTDAVPLLEKSFAVKAGLGFQGKNTLLISKKSGSYKFIAELITDLEFPADEEISENYSECAKCTRCIDICPTNALDDTFLLDSSKCISYWTIEHRGEIPQEIKKGLGEWVFGCDLCQEICPYNRKDSTLKSRPNIFPEFEADAGVGHWLYLPLVLSLSVDNFEKDFFKACEKSAEIKLMNYAKKELAKINKLSELSREDYELFLDKLFFFKFGETPLSRAKREGLIRNALIVLENSKRLLPKSPSGK